jgi:hypothetical protein
MAKFRAAGKKKKTGSGTPGGAIPCIVFLVLGLVLFSLLIFAVFRSA